MIESLSRVGNRRIKLDAKRKVKNIHLGSHKSSIVGYGIDFEEHKEYQEGLPFTSIDWRVYAERGILLIKRYEEEKNMDVFILTDATPSMFFGSRGIKKFWVLKDLVAITARSALENGDRFGFSDFREFFKPKAEKKHINKIFGYIDSLEPINYTANLEDTILDTRRMVKKNSLVLFAFDLFFDKDYGKLADFIYDMSRNYDFVPVLINDLREKELPREDIIITLKDMESGSIKTYETRTLKMVLRERRDALEDALGGMKYLELGTQNHLDEIIDYFNYR